LPFESLKDYTGGFDILIACTGAAEAIIDSTLYTQLLQGETDKKIIVDLAIPNDVSSEVLEQFPIHYIEVSSLQAIAEMNLMERHGELGHAQKIIDNNIQEFLPIVKQRRVELAMREVPLKVKEIRSLAINEVFAQDINKLDVQSREVLEKVIDYMEKKYIKVPMVMAKDILVKNTFNDVN